VPAISWCSLIQVPRPSLFGTPLKTQAQLYLFLMFFVAGDRRHREPDP
jgi:hypothetical protein